MDALIDIGSDEIGLWVDAGSDATILRGDTVACSGAAGGGTAPYSYSWSWLDGTLDTAGQSASHVYTTLAGGFHFTPITCGIAGTAGTGADAGWLYADIAPPVGQMYFLVSASSQGGEGTAGPDRRRHWTLRTVAVAGRSDSRRLHHVSC